MAEEEGERTSWQVRMRLEEGRTYWWRARASDGVFTSAWSEAWSFTINAVPEPPGVPTLLARTMRGTIEKVIVSQLKPNMENLAVSIRRYHEARKA